MSNNEMIARLKEYLKRMIDISRYDNGVAIKYGDEFSKGYTEGSYKSYKDIYEIIEKLEKEKVK